MKIDLIMISKLSKSDGGRETWLKNFLHEIESRDSSKKILFNLITLKNNEDSILEKDNTIVNNHIQYNNSYRFLPISIQFIFFCFFKFFLKRKDADHVLAVGGLEESLAAVVGYIFKNIKGKRILWLRTIYTKEKGYLLNRFTQKVLLKFEIFIIKSFFDLVIANGEDTAEFYRNHGVECHVIKNSIDLERWNCPMVTDINNKLDIAFIGRLAEVKGIKSFLESIILLNKKYPNNNFNFHVVGDGPFRNQVEDLAGKNLINFYGAIPNEELPKFMQKFEVCVALTFLSDFIGGGGVSNALIEQMAAKKVIVCWDNNIFRYVLEDESCYFVRQGDADALTEAFLEISYNREVAKKKSCKSYLLSQNYSIHNHVNSFFDLVESYK